ncbi:MAG: hypothetical protein ACRC33_10435 [Gemmataceae bacterium]
MSFNVFVIPEDFRKDQYVLQPLIEALLAECGKPRANVRVCRDPLLGGISQALDRGQLGAIIDRYKGMVQLFLLCVDRDGNAGRRAALDGIEAWAADLVGPAKRFFGVDAWQEIEVWLLAGHDLLEDWTWSEVRAEIHPKERYYVPLAESRGVADQPGEGRRQLAAVAAQRFDRIRQRCPEDIQAVEHRIRTWLEVP